MTESRLDVGADGEAYIEKDVDTNLENDFEKDETVEKDKGPQEASKEREAFLLHFDPGDSEDPRNFTFLRKVWITFIMSMLAFLGLFGTSVVAPAEPVIAAYEHSSIELTTLLVALYILGT
jgi:hypothetical protein